MQYASHSSHTDMGWTSFLMAVSFTSCHWHNSATPGYSHSLCCARLRAHSLSYAWYATLMQASQALLSYAASLAEYTNV